MSEKGKITVHVQDVSGQREYLANVPTDASWGETLQSLLGHLSLPKNTPNSETVWTGRLEREARHLQASEIVGDALQDQDRIVLQPEVNAG